MRFFKTTEQQKKYWKQRRLDWKKSYQNWEHPHRSLIIAVLQNLNWLSLIETGCGAGANLINIIKTMPGKQVGGIDINSDAIELCKKTFNGGMFKVNSADDIMMSDKSVDVVLSDACLIYVGSRKIKKYLKEIKRIGRKYIVLCEFNSRSWFKRLALKWKTGYNAYNWKRLLDTQGFYDIQLYKIPKEIWPGFPWEKFGYIIKAKIPKYV